jgi:hypothetical protein
MCRGTQRRKARCDDFREELGRKKLSSELFDHLFAIPIGSMYGIYANIWGILMVNVSIYTIHGSYGIIRKLPTCLFLLCPNNSSLCLFFA